MRPIHLVAAIAALAVAVPFASAGRGNGNGNGPQDRAPSSCSVADGVVSAVGLPTDEVVNFMITDNAGTWGWVLGFTDNGGFEVTVPAQNGSTTYEFASRTWGPHGSKYDVFASCSA
jgi:hypothetical protein